MSIKVPLTEEPSVTELTTAKDSASITLGRNLQSKVRTILGANAWLWTGVLWLGVAYVMVWRVGLHVDDYGWAYASRPNPQTGLRPSFLDRDKIVVAYPVRVMTGIVTSLLMRHVPDQEFYVRVAMAGVIGLNGLLLGLLAYRVLGSRLAGIVTGWLFLVPFFAHEAVLWLSGMQFLFSTCATLLYLHTSYQAIFAKRGWLWYAALALLALALVISFNEATLTAAGLLPLLGGLVVMRKRAAGWMRRVIVLTGLSFALIGFAYVFMYRNNKWVSHRASNISSVHQFVDRAAENLNRTLWMTIKPDWGAKIFRESLALGDVAARSSWISILFVLLAITGMVLAIAVWKPIRRDARLAGMCLLCFMFALAWAFSGLLLPASILARQQIEYRMLYYPQAGLCLAVGALMAGIEGIIGGRRCGQVLLAVTAFLVGVQAIATMGLAKGYSERFDLDQKQLRALVQLIPENKLPRGTAIVPLWDDENAIPEAPTINRLLFGVCEMPYSLGPAVGLLGGSDGMNAVTYHHWIGPLFGLLPETDPTQFFYQGLRLQADRTLIFSIRDNRISTIRTLHIRKADGSCQSFTLPLGSGVSNPQTGCLDAEVMDGKVSWEPHLTPCVLGS